MAFVLQRGRRSNRALRLGSERSVASRFFGPPGVRAAGNFFLLCSSVPKPMNGDRSRANSARRRITPVRSAANGKSPLDHDGVGRCGRSRRRPSDSGKRYSRKPQFCRFPLKSSRGRNVPSRRALSPGGRNFRFRETRVRSSAAASARVTKDAA